MSRLSSQILDSATADPMEIGIDIYNVHVVHI